MWDDLRFKIGWYDRPDKSRSLLIAAVVVGVCASMFALGIQDILKFTKPLNETEGLFLNVFFLEVLGCFSGDFRELDHGRTMMYEL